MNVSKIQFSEMVNGFKTGIFATLNEKKEELIKEGRKVYNLSVGTPDFKPAPHVMKAMQDACKDPENYKYALADLPELLKAVQYRYEKRFGVRSCRCSDHRSVWHILVWCSAIREIRSLCRIQDIRCLR